MDFDDGLEDSHVLNDYDRTSAPVDTAAIPNNADAWLKDESAETQTHTHSNANNTNTNAYQQQSP